MGKFTDNRVEQQALNEAWLWQIHLLTTPEHEAERFSHFVVVNRPATEPNKRE